MKGIIKLIIVNYLYKFIYRNSIIQTFIGFRKRKSFENYLTIRKDVEIHGKPKIGLFSLINKNTIITPLVKNIGRFCSIGTNVYIGASNHDLRQATSRGMNDIADFLDIKLDIELQSSLISMQKEINKDTFIGHDVWIGGHSVILNGVKVGDGAMIAANSVVTRDVEPYTIVGGVPAKFIKHRFDTEIIDKLIKIDFYNKPLEEIVEFVKTNPKAMIDINEFIKLGERNG